MKTVIFILLALSLIVNAIAGYLLIQSKSDNDSARDAVALATAEKLTGVADRLDRLERGFSEVKNMLIQQASDIRRLESDAAVASARTAMLKKKLDDNTPAGGLDQTDVSKAEPQYGAFSAEIFNNPEFAKSFHDQVEQVMNDVEKKQEDEQSKLTTNRIMAQVSRWLTEFAKAQNLSEYQSQELTKLFNERANQTMELFSQLRNQQVKWDDVRVKTETIRNDSNEKIRQVLLPEQFSEYQKAEAQFTRGMRFGETFGAVAQPQPPTLTPQPTPAPK